jgi:hypothetical protein
MYHGLGDARCLKLASVASIPAGMWPSKPSIMTERVLEGHGAVDDKGDSMQVHRSPQQAAACRLREDSGSVLHKAHSAFALARIGFFLASFRGKDHTLGAKAVGMRALECHKCTKNSQRLAGNIHAMAAWHEGVLGPANRATGGSRHSSAMRQGSRLGKACSTMVCRRGAGIKFVHQQRFRWAYEPTATASNMHGRPSRPFTTRLNSLRTAGMRWSLASTFSKI